MTATIQLAKPFTPGKLQYPLMGSEKLDGVPCKIHISITEDIYPPSTQTSRRAVWTVQTRQGKPYRSILDQVRAFADKLVEDGCLGTFVFIAEVTHSIRNMPFKDVSGHCRRHEQNDFLILNVFDFYRPFENSANPQGFGKRILVADMLVRDMFWCKMIPQTLIRDEVGMNQFLAQNKMARGDFIPEGAILRSCAEHWQEGKRTWGYQKVVEDPTTEIFINGFSEAISASGEGLGMIGRLHGVFKGKDIGIGPGKLTHDERRSLWIRYNATILNEWGWATVKYKRDDSYTALRQPTFQHWSPDYDGSE